MLKTPSISEEDFEKHIDCLHSVAMRVENNETFCSAHELVARNRITSRRKRILKASAQYELKPFYFLINKN